MTVSGALGGGRLVRAVYSAGAPGGQVVAGSPELQPEWEEVKSLLKSKWYTHILAVAGSPELYPELARLGAVATLCALLHHDNSDLVASTIALLRDLTDADAVEDSEEEARGLVEALVGGSALELLASRLAALDEANAEEDRAVFDTLAVFENMIELRPETAEELVKRTKLLRWLTARLKPRDFDSTKQLAAELLGILLQASPANAEVFTAMGGIDSLLQCVAPYKARNPGTDDESELVENLFNALCALLMAPEQKRAFMAAEGVELMVLILKQKRAARAGALKALDFALTRWPHACERFVEVGGLRTLFPIFMGKARLHRRRGEAGVGEAEEEERAVSVVSSLFQNLARGGRRDRVAAKFVENEYEKCDRLMELYARYTGHVRAEEERLASAAEEVAEDITPEYMLVARLGAGLFTLQQCALVLANLWFTGDAGVRKRLLQLLHQKTLTLGGLRGVLLEVHDNIGGEGGAEEAARQRARVLRLLEGLGYERPPEPEGQEEDAAVPPPPGDAPPPTSGEEPALPPPEEPLGGDEKPVAVANGDAAPSAGAVEADPFGLEALEGAGGAGPAENGGAERRRHKAKKEKERDRERKHRKRDHHRGGEEEGHRSSKRERRDRDT